MLCWWVQPDQIILSKSCIINGRGNGMDLRVIADPGSESGNWHSTCSVRRKLSSCLFVCLFAALSVMQSAYFHWFHLFIFICFSLSDRPKHLKSNTVHLQSLNSLLQQSCGVKLFLSGSQAVSHDWTKKKSALCPLLNMNNKSIHPRSPLSLSAESCWLGPLLYFFSVLFCYSCPSQ